MSYQLIQFDISGFGSIFQMDDTVAAALARIS